MNCPKCGKNLIERQGKNGTFLGCSGYPECKHTEPIKEQKGKVAVSTGSVGVTEGISEINHIFQSSYEVGAAGNRHTIKYFNVEELKAKLKVLQESGLMDDVLIDTQKF